jgi:hypothetical protein
MDYVRNERGGVLLYVLMIMIILAIFTPVILSMTTNAQLKDQRSENRRKAEMLAVSGMESFIAYLNEINVGQVAELYFESYPGWGESSQTLPDGSVANYRYFPVGTTLVEGIPEAITAGQYETVELKVTIGTGNLVQDKAISYDFWIPTGTSTGERPTTDGGVSNPLLNPTEEEFADIASYEATGGMIIGDDYEEYTRFYNQIIPTSFDYTFYNKTGTQLVNELNTIFTNDARSEITVVCYCPPSVDIVKEVDADFRQDPLQKLILYITGAPATSTTPEGTSDFNIIKEDWAMDGMLLVNGNIMVDSGSSFYANNVFVSGTHSAQGSNQQKFIVNGSAGTGSYDNGFNQAPEITDYVGDMTYDYLQDSSSWDPVRN